MDVLSFHPQVPCDLQDAIYWHERRQPGLGRRFNAAFEQAVLEIQRHPLAWPRISPRRRRRKLKKFPFGVTYLIHDLDLFIVSIADLRREQDPALERLSDFSELDEEGETS